MLSELENDYIWALTQFKEIGLNPRIVVIDGEPAIHNASHIVYLAAPTLLCTWYVNKYVQTNCRTTIGFDV